MILTCNLYFTGLYFLLFYFHCIEKEKTEQTQDIINQKELVRRQQPRCHLYLMSCASGRSDDDWMSRFRGRGTQEEHCRRLPGMWCRRGKHKYLSLFYLLYFIFKVMFLSHESRCGPELQVFERTKQTLNEQLQGGGTATSCRSQKSRLGTHPAPVERPGEVISCSQRKNSDRRLGVHLQLI